MKKLASRNDCGILICMKRDIYRDLIDWKHSVRRKPLLLKGARQTGKTYILKEFGKREYRRIHYFNFEEDSRLTRFFDRDLRPLRIIAELSAYCNCDIRPHEDLVVFDEIQASNNALNSLKYFQEECNEFHIAAAGSLLGVKMSSPGSFPVGKVNFLDLYPLNFFEFLDALGQSNYRKLLEGVTDFTSLSTPFHEDLISSLQKYYFVGGMPEAVKHYSQTGKLTQVRDIQKEIIDSYVLDFAKHAPSSDIPKLTLIWNSLVLYLARENKKFMFSALRKGARAREYENALIWLENAGLIYRAFAVECSRFPLEHYADKGCFKVYCLDVGLLGALAKTSVNIQLSGKRIFREFSGAFVENYVAQQLKCISQQNLYYWRSKSGMAELDFLCEANDDVYPLEVKSGINTKSKSFNSYDQQFNPSYLIRTTLLNLRKDGKICNISLYAVMLLFELIGKIK